MAQQEILHNAAISPSLSRCAVDRLRASRPRHACMHCGRSMLWRNCKMPNCARLSRISIPESGRQRDSTGRTANRTKSEILLKTLCNLVDQTDAKVRLQLVLALGEEQREPPAWRWESLFRMQLTTRGWPRGLSARASTTASRFSSSFCLYLTKGDLDAKTKSRQVSTIADLIATAKADGADYSKLVVRTVGSAEPDASWVFALAAACASSAGEKGKSGSGISQETSLSIRRQNLCRPTTMPRRRCEARPCSCLACRWGKRKRSVRCS